MPHTQAFLEHVFHTTLAFFPLLLSFSFLFPPHSCPSSLVPSPPPPRHRITSNIYAACTGADCSNTHITVSRFVKVCVCVYYLYIRRFSVSAGITNMFLNISGEIVWNSSVASIDILTALSGPRHCHDNARTHTHTIYVYDSQGSRAQTHSLTHSY